MVDNKKLLWRKVMRWVKDHQALTKRVGVVFAAIFVVSLGLFGVPSQNSLQSGNADTYAHAEELDNADVLEQELCVYICGQVNNPGVYYVTRGSRVCDVVSQADGFTDLAATETLNLAREVKDGEQIIVRSIEELSVASADGSTGGALLININGATVDQLQQLPGVGPSLAQKIVSHRNAQGAFTSVDDLKNVSGIGDKKLDSIRDYVCV